MDVFLFFNRYLLILSYILWAGINITLGFFLVPLLRKKNVPEVKVLVFNILRAFRKITYACWALMLGTGFIEYIYIRPISSFESISQYLMITGFIVFVFHIIWSFYLFGIAKRNEYNPLSVTERDAGLLVGGGYFNNFLIFTMIFIYAIVEMLFHL
ncbi:MAG: hypothetical protein DRP32_06385 [Thermotogae bacterium]|uniref:hypothetical protein n=1 Tax=Kosmotoga sp. TaxID=1955248 RepID=UPI000F1DDE02|nr:hypothetical protein [Kosmotoga sp.]MBO8166527.1 hypothetical protein [Kosmotoga sp.]MCD6160177.1 hypothetical protein [Kosmotoga sp.]RKX48844.1 MAG: hypothetical protein DRP32_06385 [Thermotogota bacterium]